MKHESVIEWLRDTFKGVLGAVMVTIILALLQYLGAHIAEILHFLLSAAGSITAVRIGKK